MRGVPQSFLLLMALLNDRAAYWSLYLGARIFHTKIVIRVVIKRPMILRIFFISCFDVFKIPSTGEQNRLQNHHPNDKPNESSLDNA